MRFLGKDCWPTSTCLTGTVVALALALVISDPVRAEWAVIGAHKTSYTTDAFQFSAARRLQFSEDPSFPTALDLKREQDVIWEPSLEVIRRFASTAGQPELSFKTRGFLYTLNPIFNHGDYRLQWRQALAPGMSLLMRYRYVPNLFLGPNFERRTGERLIQEERVTTHKWRLELEREFADRLKGTFVVRYGLRFYNEPFAERDTQFWTVGPKIDLVATSRATVTLGYLYERGLAEGRHEPQFRDDVSYHLHHVSLGTELRFSSRFSWALIYTYQRKDFTSDFAGDTHLGRLDQTHQGLAELAYRLTSAATLSLGIQRTQRSSTFALRGFHDTIVHLAAQYRL